MSGLYNRWEKALDLQYRGSVGRFDLFVKKHVTPHSYELRIVWGAAGTDMWHYTGVKDGHLQRFNGSDSYSKYGNLTNPPTDEEMVMIEQYVRCFVPELAEELT